MHKKQKITTALTVNFNKPYSREFCEKTMRLVFNKANRKFFGRQHKHIKAVGNFEYTQTDHIHVHYAVACPAKFMSRFVRMTMDTLKEVVPSATTKFDVIVNQNNIDKWLGYISKKNSLQVNSSTTV